MARKQQPVPSSTLEPVAVGGAKTRKPPAPQIKIPVAKGKVRVVGAHLKTGEHGWSRISEIMADVNGRPNGSLKPGNGYRWDAFGCINEKCKASAFVQVGALEAALATALPLG